MEYLAVMLAPLMWGITNHIDKYLLSKVVKNNDWRGLLIFSSFVAGLIFIPVYLIFTGGNVWIGASEFWVIFGSTAAVVLATIFYYLALAKNDTSSVAVMLQMIPAFSCVLGWVVFGESMSGWQILGGAVVTIAAVGITYEPMQKKFSKSLLVALGFMAVSCLCYSGFHVLFKMATVTADFNLVNLWHNIFLCAIGLGFLAERGWRKAFINLIKLNGKKAFALNLANEVLYSVGNILEHFAILVLPMGMVALTTNALQPILVLVMGILLTKLVPKIEREKMGRKEIVWKVACIVMSGIGIWMII